MSVLIKGGTVVTADETRRADVLCNNGKIVEVGSGIDAPAGAKIVEWSVRHAGRDRSAYAYAASVYGHRDQRGFLYRHGSRSGRWHDDDYRFRHPESAAKTDGSVQPVA